MTSAHALHPDALFLHRTPAPAKTATLRLLPPMRTTQPLQAWVNGYPKEEVAKRPREAALFVLAAVAAHAVVVAGLWSSDNHYPPAKPPQQIELLRVVAEPPPEPPKPQPPEPRRVEPVKAATPQPQAKPPAALRTAAAQPEAPPTETPSVVENLQAAKSSGPVVAAAPAPVVPVRAEEPLTAPTGFAGYLNNPAPAYPKAAQRLGMQGRVLLRVYVLASGRVGSAEIKQSSGKTLLDEAALAAVRGWTFAPAKRGETAVDAWTQVPIDFQLAQ